MRGREGVANKMLETIEQMTANDAADAIGSVLATSFQACPFKQHSRFSMPVFSAGEGISAERDGRLESRGDGLEDGGEVHRTGGEGTIRPETTKKGTIRCTVQWK